jgi:hypothetical protein
MTTSTLIRPARSVTLRAGTVLRRPCPAQASRRSQPSQVVLTVELVNDWGERWTAIGGGDTVAEAIAFAQASAPEGPAWEPLGWTGLYGD